MCVAVGPANDHRYIAEDLDALTSRLELVYWDYRGSGASEHADASTYTLERFAEDLDELRQELRDERITVLAHSMGGFVALEFCARLSRPLRSADLGRDVADERSGRMLPPTLMALGWRRVGTMVGRACAWLFAYSWRKRSANARRRLYAIWSTMQEGRPQIRAAEAAREVRLGLPLDNDNVRPLQRRFPSGISLRA